MLRMFVYLTLVLVLVLESVTAGPLTTSTTGLTYTSGNIYGMNACSGDINGDGREDVVHMLYYNYGTASLPVKLYTQNADATLTYKQDIGNHVIGTHGISCEVVDWNNDGLLDVLTHGYHGNNIQVFINQGLTNGLNTFTTASVMSGYPAIVAGINLGDFDDDGKPELIMGRSAGGIMYSSATAGNNIVISTGGTNIHGAAVLDMDGDGLKDILACQLGSKLLVYKNTGSGFAAPYEWKPFSCRSIKAVDLNKDGHMDLIVTGGTSSTFYLLNGSGGMISQHLVGISITSTWSNIEVADFDSDGDLDFLIYQQGNKLMICENLMDQGSFALNCVYDTTQRFGANVYNVDLVSLGDDGDIDVVVVNFGYGYFSTYANLINIPRPDINDLYPVWRAADNSLCLDYSYGTDCACAANDAEQTAEPLDLVLPSMSVHADQLTIVYQEPVRYSTILPSRPEFMFFDADENEIANAATSCYDLFQWSVVQPDAPIGCTATRTWTGLADVASVINGGVSAGCPFVDAIVGTDKQVTLNFAVKNYEMVELQAGEGAGTGTGDYIRRELTHLLPFKLVFPTEIDVSYGADAGQEMNIFSSLETARASIKQVVSEVGTTKTLTMQMYLSVAHPFEVIYDAGQDGVQQRVDGKPFVISAPTLVNDPNFECPDSGLTTCDRIFEWTIEAPADECSFTGDYNVVFNFQCNSAHTGECPDLSATTVSVTYGISSSHHCPVVKSIVSFDTTITAKDLDGNPISDFVDGTRVQFVATVRSDQVSLTQLSLDSMSIAGGSHTPAVVVYDNGVALSGAWSGLNLVATDSQDGPTDPTLSNTVSSKVEMTVDNAWLGVAPRTTDTFTVSTTWYVSYAAVLNTLSSITGDHHLVVQGRHQVAVPVSVDASSRGGRHYVQGVHSDSVDMSVGMSVDGQGAEAASSESSSVDFSTTSNLLFVGVCAVSLVAVLVAVVAIQRRGSSSSGAGNVENKDSIAV